ncbi:uncharacterized protein LOC116755214 [Phocoena sinus]|uniref:uncharacterized protein LOC116755214 n=1 Tax=Phocoena sinus TaxID=42100 RepID=UPI0013C3FCA4|nr:uncharacterized protein LOC116755214 [Phocoena sinus]
MPQDHGPSETPASAACQGRRALSWACRLSASRRMTPVGCDAQQSAWSVVRPDPTPRLRSQCGVGRASRLSRNPEREVLGCQLLILSSKDVIGKKTNLPSPLSTNSEQAEGDLGDRQAGRPGRGSALVLQLALGWPGSPPSGDGSLGPFSRHRRQLSALRQPRASAWGSRCHLLGQGRSRPLRHGLELQKLPLNEACFVSERESRLGEVKSSLETTLRDGAGQSWRPLPQGSPPGLVLHPLCRQTSPPALGVTVLTYKAPACPGVAQGDGLCPGPALGPLRARRGLLAGAQGEGPTPGALLGSSPRPPLPPAWLPHAPHHQACALTSRGCPAAWKGKEHGPRGVQPGRSGSGENLAPASGTLAAGCFFAR